MDDDDEGNGNGNGGYDDSSFINNGPKEDSDDDDDEPPVRRVRTGHPARRSIRAEDKEEDDEEEDDDELSNTIATRLGIDTVMALKRMGGIGEATVATPTFEQLELPRQIWDEPNQATKLNEGKDGWQCGHCQQIFKGPANATKAKAHLARKTGYEIAICVPKKEYPITPQLADLYNRQFKLMLDKKMNASAKVKPTMSNLIVEPRKEYRH
jgi:hypothetical protein